LAHAFAKTIQIVQVQPYKSSTVILSIPLPLGEVGEDLHNLKP